MNMARWFTRCMFLFHQWLEWGKRKENVRSKNLSMDTEMIYPFPEMSSKNTHSGKDNEELFGRKSTWFCGKSVKSLRYRFVSKYICVVKNSTNSSCNIMRICEIRDCFEKVKCLSWSINGSIHLSTLALMHINLNIL